MVRQLESGSPQRTSALVGLAFAIVLSSCGGGASGNVASGQEAIALVAKAKEQGSTSSKSSESTGDCAAQGPTEFGRSPVCADSGFRKDDALSFSNWAGKRYVNDSLTIENLTALFGSSVCASVEGKNCTLSKGALALFEKMQQGYEQGRCEGMVVMAALLSAKAVSVDEVDGKAQTTSQLSPDNEVLQGGIAYWWSTQFSATLANGTTEIRNQGLKGIVRQLKTNLPKGAFATMGIYFSGRGHALLPVGLTRRPDGVYEIIVYDSNVVDRFKTVTVDLTADKWEYEFGGGNGAPSDVWSGTSGLIDLSPMTLRDDLDKCAYCDDPSPSDVTVTLETEPIVGRERVDSIFASTD